MKRIRAIKGFTLIELLIVVAIIGILAAIAIPNFLQAQTRSKVAIAQADMRSLATAIETYRVDQSAYPPGQSAHIFGAWGLVFPALYLSKITTPVDYISSIPQDPFPALRDVSTSELLRINYLFHSDHFKTVQETEEALHVASR